MNPVAAPYFNFTVTEPMGIVGVIAPEEAPLLGPGLAARAGHRERQHRGGAGVDGAAVSGDRAGRDAGHERPARAASSICSPACAGNCVPTFATHAHLRALGAVADAEERKTLALGAVESVKRTRFWKSFIWFFTFMLYLMLHFDLLKKIIELPDKIRMYKK